MNIDFFSFREDPKSPALGLLATSVLGQSRGRVTRSPTHYVHSHLILLFSGPSLTALPHVLGFSFLCLNLPENKHFLFSA